MNDGKFFEKRAKPEGGRFFRDQPGRESGDFHKEANTAYGPGVGAAMSGQMGGSFGVGSSATGGGMYGTGDGKKGKKPPAADSQVAKNAVTIMPGTGDGGKKKKKSDDEEDEAQVAKNSVTMEEGEKKAEVDQDHEGHGWHRATDEQPVPLESGGSRFLQESHGAKAVSDPLTSGLTKQRLKKSAADLRFLGTSFNKTARDPNLPGTVAKDIKGTPGAAGDWGKRVGRSAHQGAEKVWKSGKKVVSGAADTVADSPALSLAALLGGGLLAARGGGRAAKALLRRGRKKKAPKGLLDKVRSRIAGK